jgi:hypothetical protein
MSVGRETPRAFNLIAAIVAGDADMKDGVASLTKEGISSLEDALLVLKQELSTRTLNEDPIDFRQLRKESPPEATSHIKHIVPEFPFILHGTEYEPQDITRFDGQELHFIATPNSDHMLAVDDRNLIVDWWQFSYFDRYRESPNQHIRSDIPEARTNFRDDPNLRGYVLPANANRGYERLSEVDRGIFGDWNDVISSFSMSGVQVAQLHEHKYYGGESFSWVLPYGTEYGEVRDLGPYGWGDRASSVGTW